jgi:hypothetical protein
MVALHWAALRYTKKPVSYLNGNETPHFFFKGSKRLSFRLDEDY